MRLQKLLGTVLIAAAVLFAGCSSDSENHSHSWSIEYASDATTHWIKCSGCAEIKDKTAHTAEEVLSKNETNHWKVCEVCSKEYETAEHNYSNWQEVTAATEEADGLEKRVCDDCGYEATRAIPQLNHTHKFAAEWTQGETTHWHAATCSHDEKREETAHSTTADLSKDQTNHWKVCDVCGGKYDVTAHTEDTGTVTTAPSCTEKGVRTYKCAVCEEVLRTEEIAALRHTEDTGTVTTAPTCVTKGVRTYKCAVCEEVLRTEEISELYSSPVDAETGLAATSSSTYIYFGVFPKTVLPETSTVTVDEDRSITMGANTYYPGSDGNYYAKVKEYRYGSIGHTYTDGTTVKRKEENSYRYFKVEPVKWKVLTANYNNSNNALLLAEDILTANVPYYKYDVFSNTRTVDSDTSIYPNNYKYSQIRAYLNGLDYYYDLSSTSTVKKTYYTGNGFLQTAFTATAQSKIADTEVDNSKETTGYSKSTYAETYACANTTDKIFLLSESEVINTAYGFAAYNSYGLGNARIRFPTDFAKANYAYQSTTAGEGGKWWLRSPHYDGSFYVYSVSYRGYPSVIDIVYDNDSNSSSYYTDNGVVPALCISLH